MKKSRLIRFLGYSAGGLIAYLLLLIVLIQLEKGAGDDASITNLLDGIWFSIVTLTTVGYGDMSPVTIPGKLVGILFVLASMGVLGLLVGQIASIIQEVRQNARFGYNGTTFTQHVVIVGWDRFAQTVAEQILAANGRIAIVTDDQEQIELISEAYDKRRVYTLLADFFNLDMLEKTRITDSNIVFVNLPDDTDKLVYLINGKKRFGEAVDFGVIVNDSELVATFENAGATIALSRDAIDAKLIASYVFEAEVAQLTERLIGAATDTEDQDIQEYRVTEKNPFRGMAYNDAFFSVKQRFGAILVGISTTRQGERTVLENPTDPKLTIEAGDFLLVITTGGQAIELQRAFGTGEGAL